MGLGGGESDGSTAQLREQEQEQEGELTASDCAASSVCLLFYLFLLISFEWWISAAVVLKMLVAYVYKPPLVGIPPLVFLPVFLLYRCLLAPRFRTGTGTSTSSTYVLCRASA